VKQLDLADLFGEEIPVPTDTELDLAELPTDLPGPKPGRDLIESVQRLGVLQPIIVICKPSGELHVADGRRRLQAAREAGLTSIPARVYGRDGLLSSVMTLVTNQQRRPNAVAELDAILALAKGGASEEVIRDATGIPVQTIRRRMKLAKLNETLLEGMRVGKVSLAVGERVATMPPTVQARLADKFAAKGKLTESDVDEERSVGVAEVVAALPWESLDTPDVERDEPEAQAEAEPLVIPGLPARPVADVPERGGRWLSADDLVTVERALRTLLAGKRNADQAKAALAAIGRWRDA
jgi:ParB/RepB/Spo0J family partition protein